MKKTSHSRLAPDDREVAVENYQSYGVEFPVSTILEAFRPPLTAKIAMF
jgi:hypothetical protein